jgi:hypothetical protein
MFTKDTNLQHVVGEEVGLLEDEYLYTREMIHIWNHIHKWLHNSHPRESRGEGGAQKSQKCSKSV